MKKITIIFVLFTGFSVNAQNELDRKWYSNVDLELIMHNKI
jgi:hypothetical protein